MRKGDEKKAEILSVSERLFLTRGYEATSIQDILDVLHTSKGGFYHHFVSKDAVLGTLCAQHAEDACGRAEEELKITRDPMQRLNKLMYCFLPLRKEELPFMTMLLPTLDKAESLSVRVSYQEALAAAFKPVLERELLGASREGIILPVVREAAQPVLLLLNQCWVDACLYLLSCVRGNQRYEPAALLSVLESGRRCIEVLLDAPYGSVELLDLAEWNGIAETVLKQLRTAN